MGDAVVYAAATGPAEGRAAEASAEADHSAGGYAVSKTWIRLPDGLRVDLSEIVSYRPESSGVLHVMFRGTSDTVVYTAAQAYALFDALEARHFVPTENACEGTGKEAIEKTKASV